MKRVKSIFKLLLIAAFFVTIADLVAADKSIPKDVPEPSVAAAWQRRLSAIAYEGVPLNEVVKNLREGFPELNFIVKEKARSEGVSLILRSVTLDELLKAIEPATDGRVRVIWPTNADDRLIIFDRGRGAGALIDPATGLPIPGGDEKICRVFSLSKYLARVSEKDIDAAITEIVQSLETAWSMLRAANDDQEEIPRLNLHRGTKLLIAVGRRADLDILEQAVKELQGSAPASDESASKPAYYRLWLDVMKERGRQAEELVQLRQKEEDLKRAEELHQQKLISAAQYQIARTAVDALRSSINERSNLLQRIDADVKNFALPEQGRGLRSSGKE